MYVELHSCSAFGFLEGASLPEELAEAAAQFGMPAMALLDRDGVYGSPRFHSAAKKANIRAHIGAEISVGELGNQATYPRWMPNQVFRVASALGIAGEKSNPAIKTCAG